MLSFVRLRCEAGTGKYLGKSLASHRLILCSQTGGHQVYCPRGAQRCQILKMKIGHGQAGYPLADKLMAMTDDVSHME